MGHGLEGAPEPVPELPRAFSHAPDDALVPGEEDDDLVLVADGHVRRTMASARSVGMTVAQSTKAIW